MCDVFSYVVINDQQWAEPSNLKEQLDYQENINLSYMFHTPSPVNLEKIFND